MSFYERSINRPIFPFKPESRVNNLRVDHLGSHLVLVAEWAQPYPRVQPPIEVSEGLLSLYFLGREPRLSKVFRINEVDIAFDNLRTLVRDDSLTVNLEFTKPREIEASDYGPGKLSLSIKRNDLPAKRPKITVRERQVLRLLSEGMSQQAISRTLGISPNTVNNYLGKIGSSLGIAGTKGIIEKARELGIDLRESQVE